MTNIKTRLSGIYDKPFYTPYSIGQIKYDIDNLEIPEDIVQNSDYDIEDYEDQEEMEQTVRDEIMEAIFMLPTVWEVNEFDYDINLAIKCSLIPFEYYDQNKDETKHCLALGGCGTDLSPRLEMYQFLQDGTMDECGKLYRIIHRNYNDIDYFETVTYKGAIKEVKAILASNTEQAA